MNRWLLLRRLGVLLLAAWLPLQALAMGMMQCQAMLNAAATAHAEPAGQEPCPHHAEMRAEPLPAPAADDQHAAAQNPGCTDCLDCSACHSPAIAVATPNPPHEQAGVAQPHYAPQASQSAWLGSERKPPKTIA